MSVSGVHADSHSSHPSLELFSAVLWIPSLHTPQNNCLLPLRQFQTFSRTPSQLAVVHKPLSGRVHAANPSPLPGVWPPKLEPQLPAPTCPGGWADKPLGLVSAGCCQSSVRESLHFALCSPVAALSSVAPKLPPPTTPCPHQWRGFLVCGDFSSFKAPSQRFRSQPYSFVSVYSFFFCPTPVHGEFLAFWEVWGLLPAFSRCSVGVVPHVDVFLMYLWGVRWSLRLTLPPSWRSLEVLNNVEVSHGNISETFSKQNTMR